MDIFEFALKKETLAHETYKKLSEQTTSNSLKGILNLLAEEELKHVDMVRALQQNQPVDIPQTNLLGEAKKVFEKINKGGETFNFNISDTDLYSKARQIEIEARDYYRNQAKDATDDTTKEILLKLAAEEEKHYVLVDNLCHFVERPQSYLEDAEFNHLDNYAEEPF